MRTAVLVIVALWLLAIAAAPATDCGGLTAAQCERARLIDAGAID